MQIVTVNSTNEETLQVFKKQPFRAQKRFKTFAMVNSYNILSLFGSDTAQKRSVPRAG